MKHISIYPYSGILHYMHLLERKKERKKEGRQEGWKGRGREG